MRLRARLRALLPALALLSVASGTALGEEAARKAAIFPAEVNDPTLAYGRKPLPADQKRLDLVTEVLRQQLAEKGGLESVDLGPQAAEIRKESPLYKCNGCTGPIAKALGAELAVTTFADKGANQLFSLVVTIANAESGQVVRQGQVVIRANTDDDWSHAARWIVKNRLLAEPLPGRS
ncbi:MULTISPECIES: DUF3280 domain-containing protein [Methylorubrum]|jgi:hypothetical protein|uniref:DUF2380 domain-containing protein n=2 Tax=Methylorubrum TaxID=2282523 RepID=B1ZID9_METPB|nr:MULTISPECIES: DUF3280 domain-containing protein [Methylorubrum]ACB79959.1 conserved hypothetical protein [Methylorubrum populi BJ001]MBA8911208.1 hypothetical protein [Methylorubrum thiocyanatum]OAH33202.1 hypothetical protein AX289_05635 [Methylorubrum populi]PZP71999.1 MAG: DUF2380 domain-containing protein [Methylorubrum populi]GJE82777.1 hypothetical protein CJNNKLLH_4144 [Methylorubrum thiocyanatum]